MSYYCERSNQEHYPFSLPDLPYPADAFIPYFSEESFEYHHGKHHLTYVNNLNKLLDESHKDMQNSSLEDIISKTHNNDAAVFNNAAQIWNHSFFWHCLKPNNTNKAMPHGNLANKINQDFGSYEQFFEQFKTVAVSQFGSGWAWLVYSAAEDKIKIVKTSNADTPIVHNLQPLITCDVWEHAYYIDYRNKRLDYVTLFLERFINWDFAEMHFNRARQ